MRCERITVAICLASVAACLGDGTGGPTRWVTEFEYMRRGGECPTVDGPVLCDLRVVVRDNGTWSATGVPEPPSDGTISLGAATELAEIFDNRWRDLTQVAFEGVCATAKGGEEYGYVVRNIPIGAEGARGDVRVREVRSCWYDLERYDSLVRRNQIEMAWLDLKPPELDHVEFR